MSTTRKETAELLTVLQSNYPDAFRGMSDNCVQAKIALWQQMFAEYPKQQVFAAAMAYMATDTKGFMPSVGQVNEQLQRMLHRMTATPAEAWSYVSAALRNSSYGAAEEFAKLPEDVQRLVGSPAQLREWAQMDAQTVQSVIGSNFQRSYQARQTQQRDYEKLPGQMKQLLRGLGDALGLESGKEDSNDTE
ncbi:MAG: replicative helicase loader/inhibitor [Faecousia sp.]